MCKKNESAIIALRNLISGKVYFFKSKLPENDIVNERFKLDLNLHSCKKLQEDYEKTGLEAFQFEVEEKTLEKDLSSRLDFYLKNTDKTKLYN
ncbi:MAG: hypothetical protein WC162_01175 [Sphaerochaetaceae bacterium]|nr:hypothetical protein [Sphaerochaetaceae bacterium]